MDKLVAGRMRIVFLLFTMFGLAAQPPDPAALSRQAGQAMAAGNYTAAVQLYRKLIAQLPNVGGLRMNLGLALFQSGQIRPALTELQAALKLDPSLAPASMMLGVCHARLGEPLAAVPLLEKSLHSEPANPVVLRELADAYYTLGRYPPAIDHFRRLTTLQPANPAAWRGLGLSLTDHSQSLFTKLSPDSAEALTLLARAKLAASEPKAAFTLLRRALAKNPQFGPAHTSLAELYTQSGHPDWAAAETARAAPPTGTFAEIESTSTEALQALAKLASLGPSSELYETEAEAARARGAYPEAITSLQKALNLKPGNSVLERSLARALFQGRNFEQAIPLLTKYSLSAELGESLLELGKPAEAIPHLGKVRTPAAQAALGRAYLALDQPAKAILPLRAALPTDTDGGVHFQLARALQRTGDAAGARQMDQISQQMRQKKTEQQDALGAIEITPP